MGLPVRLLTQCDLRAWIYPDLGPVDTSLPAETIPTDNLVLQTSKLLSSEFPFNLDYNSGNTIGIGEHFLAFPPRLINAKQYFWHLGWSQFTVRAAYHIFILTKHSFASSDCRWSTRQRGHRLYCTCSCDTFKPRCFDQHSSNKGLADRHWQWIRQPSFPWGRVRPVSVK